MTAERSYRVWLDEDDHLWQEHECVGGELNQGRLPNIWRVTEDGITPSISCSECGLHEIVHVRVTHMRE